MDIGKLLAPDGSGGARDRAAATQGASSNIISHSVPPTMDTMDTLNISPLDRNAGLSLLATLAETHDTAARLAAESASSGQSPAATPEASELEPRSSPDSEHTRGPASPSRRPRPPTGEKAREKKLRDDALARVLSPQLVLCERCGARIKLSLKSTFDPFHWQKHRERCLRRPDGLARELKAQNEQTARRPAFPAAARIAARKPSPASSASLSPPPPSPPSAVKQEPQPTPPPSPPETVFRAPDPGFEEYLRRSRRRATREVAPLSLERGLAWSWAQLKEPAWGPDGAPATLEYPVRGELARALSPLSAPPDSP